MSRGDLTADGSNQTTFASGTRNPTALAVHPQLTHERQTATLSTPSRCNFFSREAAHISWLTERVK